MENRHIVITGVSRGLGRALVEGFIEQGHAVAGCSRSAEAIGELQTRFGPPNSFAVVDVADDAQVGDWAERVLTDGAPDLLICNAGVINANGPLWRVPADEFSAVIDTNVKGVANVVRHFVPAMVERRRGVIVNLSSGWGRSVSAEVAPYCASKWAIEGLTLALAEELPKGMAAVPLNPGIIDTLMLRSCFGESAASYPSPKDWAKRAVPLLLKLGPKDNGRPLTVPS
ncbi:MAG TPA: oxidoreductase [Planctomycetaceae bacterium]|nr:oxidoreductase [Planctomycetaceae bacterium]